MDAIEKKILTIIDSHADELQTLAMDIYRRGEQGPHLLFRISCHFMT